MSTSISSVVRTALSTLLAGALAVSAHAQVGQPQVRVAIPFAFQDGSAHLSPGVYTLGLQGSNIMVVRGVRGAGAAISIVNLNETAKPTAQGKVVFHKYGNSYFLHEVWISGSSVNLQCPQSKAERKLQKELQVASSDQAPNSTEVALLELPH